MRQGLAVEHATHGAGVVARVLDGGRRCLVRFDARPSVPYVVPVEALTWDADDLPEETEVPEEPPEEPPAPDSDRPSDRQALEALRLGVVPARAVHSVTVDRHSELARLGELLDRGQGMLVISGGYGSGKTHLVELAEAEALSRRYAVARAVFDPFEVPPSHPLRLYAALTRGLVYPDGSGGGLRPLLEFIGDSEEHLYGRLQHRWLSAALFAVHHAPPELADTVLSFVQGHTREDHRTIYRKLTKLGYRGPSMLALPDYRTFGQIMAHMLGGIAAWVKAGRLAGLVLLLDEAEYIDRLAATSREMAENVLRYLAIGAMRPDQLAFSVDEVYRGGHAAHRNVPARFTEEQSLAVVCAFTPNPEIDGVLARLLSDGEARLDLEPIRPSLFGVLAEKIYGLVQRAHPDIDPEAEHRRRVAAALARAFDSGQIASTRQAARMVVEFWDIYRLDARRALRALNVP